MVKVSITLPNNTQITLEAEEPEVLHQIILMALRDLPRDLMQSSEAPDGAVPGFTTREKGSSATNNTDDSGPAGTVVPGKSTDAFMEFCQSANPLTDMRRVVVAAEGGRRFLGLDSIDAEELGRLFDLAGWRRPHSFVQTLRNAARRKFQWIESIPGRSGHYTVTSRGRTVVLDG